MFLKLLKLLKIFTFLFCRFWYLARVNNVGQVPKLHEVSKVTNCKWTNKLRFTDFKGKLHACVNLCERLRGVSGLVTHVRVCISVCVCVFVNIYVCVCVFVCLCVCERERVCLCVCVLKFLDPKYQKFIHPKQRQNG